MRSKVVAWFTVALIAYGAVTQPHAELTFLGDWFHAIQVACGLVFKL